MAHGVSPMNRDIVKHNDRTLMFSIRWQMPVIPFFKTMVALMGIVSASAAQEIWGTAYWTPLQIIDTWMDTSGGRAAAFFCASI